MYLNPYSGTSFFEFFIQLFIRIFALLTGKIGFSQLVSDEIQILVLSAVAISSATLGCFLVLRRMTMLANALSHTILLGIVMVYFFGASSMEDHFIPIYQMLLASLGMGILTTFLTEFLTRNAGLQEDASIGIVFTSLFALGVIFVTVLTRSAHIGTEIVMGNADALSLNDLYLAAAVLVINLLLLFLFYKEYKITTFDPALSIALGISPLFYSYLLMVQVSATAIGGFRAVGVLMVLAFMTGPALTARLLTNRLSRMIALSALIGVLASLIGVALSRHILSVTGAALSTGGIVVCVIGIFFILALLYKLYLRIMFQIRSIQTH